MCGLLRGTRAYAFLASLRMMTSSEYFTPLPLYGSGLRNARILAATSPTTCLSAPWTRISVWVGVVMVMPSGATNTTGCEKRSEEHTSELQSQSNLVCRLLLEKKKKNII